MTFHPQAPIVECDGCGHMEFAVERANVSACVEWKAPEEWATSRRYSFGALVQERHHCAECAPDNKTG